MRLATGDQVHGIVGEHREGLHRAEGLPIEQVGPLGVGHDGHPHPRGRMVHGQEPIAVGIGKGVEENAIHHAEDGRVGANPDRERNPRQGREERLASQPLHCQSNVPKHAFHRPPFPSEVPCVSEGSPGVPHGCAPSRQLTVPLLDPFPSPIPGHQHRDDPYPQARELHQAPPVGAGGRFSRSCLTSASFCSALARASRPAGVIS